MARPGIKRLARDVFCINGKIVFDHYSQPILTVLNQANPLARALCRGLVPLLAQEQVVVALVDI